MIFFWTRVELYWKVIRFRCGNDDNERHVKYLWVFEGKKTNWCFFSGSTLYRSFLRQSDSLEKEIAPGTWVNNDSCFRIGWPRSNLKMDATLRKWKIAKIALFCARCLLGLCHKFEIYQKALAVRTENTDCCWRTKMKQKCWRIL